MNFDKVFLQYQKMIYNLAWRLMGNRQDAEDITQDVAVKVYRNLHKCKGEEFVAAWISRIVHNTCMDMLRRRKGRVHESLDEIVEIGDGQAVKQVEDDNPGPEELLLQKELGEQIEAAIEQLSAGHRLLIVLRDINGHTYEEIAQILGLPEGTIKSRLFRGRAKLKSILLREQNVTNLRQDI